MNEKRQTVADTLTIGDWSRRRRDIGASFPNDLLEDIKDEEPHLYNEAYQCDVQLATLRREQARRIICDEEYANEMNEMEELRSSVSSIALLPSILTKGWDAPKRNKHGKNWADMENLLKLYAIGLYFKGIEMTPQAQHDYQELSHAAEVASLATGRKKGIPAQKRLEKAKTYLRFGLRTLDAEFQKDPGTRYYDLQDLEREIQETSNDHNAQKLTKSKNMAQRVAQFIRNRYRTE